MKKLKKTSLLSFIMFIALMASCQKDEVVENEVINNELKFNDVSNTNPVEWKNFPEELKNATPLSSLTENESKEFSYSVGPFGGQGGSVFNVNPPSGTKIQAIAIRAGRLIDQLVIYYRTPSGSIYTGATAGGNGGTYHLHIFEKDEYITGISGRADRLLDKLSIQTNKRFFSYGKDGGTAFDVSIPPNFQVLGFYGRSGRLIDRIGFHIHTL